MQIVSALLILALVLVSCVGAARAFWSAPQILSSGRPYLIYGTAWKGGETYGHVYDAIMAGFRFVDTACQPRHYFEPGVGEGWVRAAQELRLSRSDLHFQTKFSSLKAQDPDNIPYDKDAPLEDQVRQSLAASLVNLKTLYVDSLIMHGLESTHEDSMRVWRVFESFVDDGRVLKLGISNCYDLQEFASIYDEARVKPSYLQNRFYADTGFDIELRKFCAEKGVTYQSFWTLAASRDALATPEAIDMARAKGLTPQTLMYAFMMRLNHTPLDGTTSVDHMKEDVEVMMGILKGKRIFDDDTEVRRFGEDILGMPEVNIPEFVSADL